MTARTIRVAVDIGGTFTDLEFLDEATGTAASYKTPTVADDPAAGLIRAVAGAAERHGFSIEDVGLLLHGTTIATNAVLTRSLPEAALITNEGFEDVLEIGRHARRDVYGLKAEPRSLLAPRRRRFGVRGRIGAGGREIEPLDMASVDRAIDAVAASGARVVAIGLLNAFADPAHERAVRERLRARLPGVECCCSHEISPEMREFERLSTTLLNALLTPVIRGYLGRLEARTAEAGLTAPVYLIQSNGGAANPAAAAEAPVRLLLSGPSGGVLAARSAANTLGLPNVVAVDMGGTSYDISLIQDGEAAIVTEGEIDGLPVRVPMVEMRTIGAGGGSIVAVDAGGRLTVGPASAGSTPGPVCYRRGGREPTVTDVNLILGRLDAASFLGGAMPLDRDGALVAFEGRIARPLGLPADEAAAGVLSVVVAKLAAAIKLSLFEKGLDPRDFALMSFGGAGGLHAVEVAEELGINTVVFPREPSTFSAHGILRSDVVHDLAEAWIQPLGETAEAAIAAAVERLTARGAALLAGDGFPEKRRDLAFSADLRYRGQAFELTLPLGEGASDARDLARRFHAAHRQRFSFDDPDESVELVTLRLAAIGRLPAPPAAAPPPPRTAASPARRRIHLGGWRDAPVHEQAALAPGREIDGPCIVEQPYTTLLITEGWRARVAPTGDLVARRIADSEDKAR